MSVPATRPTVIVFELGLYFIPASVLSCCVAADEAANVTKRSAFVLSAAVVTFVAFVAFVEFVAVPTVRLVAVVLLPS